MPAPFPSRARRLVAGHGSLFSSCSAFRFSPMCHFHSNFCSCLDRVGSMRPSSETSKEPFLAPGSRWLPPNVQGLGQPPCSISRRSRAPLRDPPLNRGVGMHFGASRLARRARGARDGSAANALALRSRGDGQPPKMNQHGTDLRAVFSGQ